MKNYDLPKFIVDTIANQDRDTIRVVRTRDNDVFSRATFPSTPAYSADRQEAYRIAHSLADYLCTVPEPELATMLSLGWK